MKGIILAGGNGTRLKPLTLAVSKQLLPLYDTPMVYHPLSTLMIAGIREILLISTPEALFAYRKLLGDGHELGLQITYAEQAQPNGLAEALIIGADHIDGDLSALVLGDNMFHGAGFPEALTDSVKRLASRECGCVLFGHQVPDPWRYGVGEADSQGHLLHLEEKPEHPRSDRAITGLYLYDEQAVDIARELTPSRRGELEITDLNKVYVEQGRARLVDLGSDIAWMDAGTHESLIEAGRYVQRVEHEEGVRIACIEEQALRMGFIDADACYELGSRLSSSGYGDYIMRVASSFGARSWPAVTQA